jgi:hypothetical protein
MSLWLTPDELAELTGYRKGKRQKLALGQMGIPFVSRALDGYPMVSRSIFEQDAIKVKRNGKTAN